MAGVPRSLQQIFAQGRLTVGAGWRGYFAPFNTARAIRQTSTSIGPTILDLQSNNGKLSTAQIIAAGFFDLGYMDGVKPAPGSKIGSIASGYRGATRAKYRGQVAENLTVVFHEHSRLAHKVAFGTQIFNLIQTTGSGQTAGPLSGSGIAAVPLAGSGYLPTGLPTGPTQGFPTLCIPLGSASAFAVGQNIVCDDDYAGQTGYVGSQGAAALFGGISDVDYFRKASDFVNTISAIVPGAQAGVADALVLTGVFVGGGNNPNGTGLPYPDASAKIQIVNGWSVREGGTQLVEWSGLFAMDTMDGAQFLAYYPRLSPNTMSGFTEKALANAGTTDLKEAGLTAQFEAMAYDDPLDGETVVRYLNYYPAPGVRIQDGY